MSTTLGRGGDSVALDQALDAGVSTAEVFGFPMDYGMDSGSAQLVTGGTLQGSWKVYVSNDYVAPATSAAFGQRANAGTWTDVTARFFPTLVAVTGAGSDFIQFTPIAARALKISFTPSSGAGQCSIFTYSKRWS